MVGGKREDRPSVVLQAKLAKVLTLVSQVWHFEAVFALSALILLKSSWSRDRHARGRLAVHSEHLRNHIFLPGSINCSTRGCNNKNRSIRSKSAQLGQGTIVNPSLLENLSHIHAL